uniref:High mobility group protein B2 n=1 Tax=Callorhinchus milii TaxID=7868 RepID=K4G323_CALMI|nr:high mobility group protein [Callorhinchus milii]
MGKRDPRQPRGKMSSYAFFVQNSREEHKKKHPDSSVDFSEFSKQCSERWKAMTPKDKGKFEDLAKNDKVRYDREMRNYNPPKGDKKKKKDPNAPKRPPSAFFIFCSDHRPRIRGENPGISIGDVAKKMGELWSGLTAKDKKPYEERGAQLKEKCEKEVAAYRARCKNETCKKPPPKQVQVAKKRKQDDDDDDDDDDEEEEDEEEEEEDDDDEE